jgi:tetratricopeptide (TPR) repeat protein
VELDNASAPAHVALGEVYVRTGQLDTALSELQLALQLDPAAFDAEFHIGEAFEAQGKFDEAEAAYKSLVNRRPGFPVGFSGLGTFYYRHGQFQRAADQFQAMIDLQPDNFLAYEDLAGVDIAMARYEEAVGVLTKELAHKQTSSAWTNLGNAYMYLKRYPEAADAMLKATQLDPHNDILWRNLGDSYRQIPSRAADATLAYQKALQCATDELTVNPNDTEVLSGIALYHAHLGHKREAGLYISKALQLSPKNSDVLFTSALVYEIIGHRDKALDALAKAFDAGYSLADIEGEPELAGLRADIRYQHWLRLKKSALIVSHNLSDQEVLNEAGSRKV